MKFTVGLFNDSYYPIMDGVANTVRNYAYWYNKKYGKSYVITPKFPKYIDHEEFEVIRYISTNLPLRYPYRLGMPIIANQTKKMIKQIDFDILHVHCPFSSGKLALNLAKDKHIPVIASFHSKFYEDFKQILKNDFLAKLALKKVIAFYEKADYVWTVNDSTTKTLREYGFKGKIEVMPNGTDFYNNINNHENNDFFHKNYQISPNELIFLFVGQHIWQKNLKLIIESLNILKKGNFKFKMYFIGEGYAKNDLSLIVKKYNLTNQVFIMGKITDRQLLKRFFARANLFLFPSTYDTSGIVIKEAAMVKTPSIVIEGTNAQEGIVDGVNGFTCKESYKSFADKIKLVCQDKQFLKLNGEKAQETLALSWESIIDKVADRYEEIIMNSNNFKKTYY